MPTLVLFLARMGVVTARFLIRHIKYAMLDHLHRRGGALAGRRGVGMLAMAGPMIVLYVFSIGLAWMFGKKTSQRRSKKPRSVGGRGRRRPSELTAQRSGSADRRSPVT